MVNGDNLDMKKILMIFVLFCAILGIKAPAYAGYCGSHAYYSHHTCPVYVINQEFFEEQTPFHDCKDHSLLTETTVNYYSNGTSRTFKSYSILDKNGDVISGDFSEIKHIQYNKKHFFIVKQKKTYKILGENGVEISKRNYTELYEIAPNKLVAKVDKKYGIIDLDDDIIVPLKYKKFERISGDAFLTKLNGYWGIIDSDNNVLVKNDCDSITPLYETQLLKKFHKYGLATNDGDIILEISCSKIKKLGEYILVKRGRRYGLFSSTGEKITDIKYKKIRLERNTLEGYINKQWQVIYTSENI